MTDNLAAPYPGSYWVVPGSLLAGPYPGSDAHHTNPPYLEQILDAGILSVISLMDEEEVNSLETGDHFLPYADELEALGEQRNVIVEIENFAIEEGAAISEDEMTMILDAIDAEIDGRNSPTLIHCSTGHGRTGLVVGCYLARHGIATGQAVLDKIKELRAHDPALAEIKSPENMVQERFVTRWKQDQ